MPKDFGRIKLINQYRKLNANPVIKRLVHNYKGFENDHGSLSSKHGRGGNDNGAGPSSAAGQNNKRSLSPTPDTDSARAKQVALDPAADSNVMQEEEVRADEEEGGDEEMQQMSGGSGAAGSGSAMQSMTPIMPRIPVNNKAVMTFRHRQKFYMRNFESGSWQKIPVTPVNGTQRGYFYSLNSDFLVIPNHLHMFYCTAHELDFWGNPMNTSVKYHKAGFTITGVKVRPNVQVGGTDLRWASNQNNVPDVIFPPGKDIMYPYWQLNNAARIGPGGGTAAPVFTDEDLQTNIQGAKEDGGWCSRMELGTMSSQVSSSPITNPYGLNGLWLLKDTTVEPVTNLVGKSVGFPTWQMKHRPMDWGRGSLGNSVLGTPNTSFGYVTGRGYVDLTANGNQQQVILDNRSGRIAVNKSVRGAGGRAIQVDVRQMRGQGTANAYLDNIGLAHFPIGPLMNSFYDECPTGATRGIHGDKGGIPFMMKLDDIPNPDEKVEDYTITLFLESELVVEFGTENLGSNWDYTAAGNGQNHDVDIYQRCQRYHNFPIGQYLFEHVNRTEDRYNSSSNFEHIPKNVQTKFWGPYAHAQNMVGNVLTNASSRNAQGVPTADGNYVSVNMAAQVPAESELVSGGSYGYSGEFAILSRPVPAARTLEADVQPPTDNGDPPPTANENSDSDKPPAKKKKCTKGHFF